MDKYFEGKNVIYILEEVVFVFEEGMQFINEGKRDEGFVVFGKLLKWFGDIVFLGGLGFIGLKKMVVIIIYLEFGYYIMECYVKMLNGMFYILMGMVKFIIVINEDSGNILLDFMVNIFVLNIDGIVYDKIIIKGK